MHSGDVEVGFPNNYPVFGSAVSSNQYQMLLLFSGDRTFNCEEIQAGLDSKLRGALHRQYHFRVYLRMERADANVSSSCITKL